MRSPASALTCALAFAVLIGACSAGEPEAGDTTTTAAPATTVAPTTTSTTTTTLPPGQQPTILTYHLTDRTLLDHDVAVTTTITMEATGGGLDDDDMVSTVATNIEGTQRTLYLATGDETFEMVQDFKGEHGSVSISMDGTEINQEIDEEEAATFPMGSPPVLMATNGAPAEGRTGAPAFYEGAPRPGDLLELHGPVFGPDPVDEGDTWQVELADPVLGTVTVEGTITREVETDDGFVFEFETTSNITSLPLQLTFEEAVERGDLSRELLGLIDPAVQDLLGGESSFTIHSSATTASGVFDPTAGVVTEYHVDSTTSFAVELTVMDEEITIDYATHSEATYTLTDTATASSFEVSSVLDRFESDPYDLAYDALPILADYGLDQIDEDVFTTMFDKFDMTLSEIIAGVSFLRYVAEDGTAVDVAAITNGSYFRGDPYLPEALSGYWSDRTPTRVTVNGRTAFRTTIDGTEWLFWSSDTHLFVAVGPRTASADVVGQIMDTVDPYLWEAGDCLDFRDFDGEMPFSPYGKYGLAHCSTNHQVEVLHSEVLDDGPDAAYPDDIGDRLHETCGAKFHEHTGGYPLTSSLEMIRYMPNQDEWDRGARYIACVLALVDADGKVTVDSRLEGAGTEFPVELTAGTCLANLVPVDCDDPHQIEIIEVAEYDAAPGAERPDFSDVIGELDDACQVPLEDYGVTDGPFDVEAGAITDMYLGWDNGLRTYYCMAFAEDDDGWPVDVTGKFTGQWEEAPEAVDA